jgi:hypothetical protein
VAADGARFDRHPYRPILQPLLLTVKSIESLLQPFLDQSAPVKSIASVGRHHVLEMIEKELPAPPVETPQEAILLQFVREKSRGAVKPAKFSEPLHWFNGMSGELRSCSDLG